MSDVRETVEAMAAEARAGRTPDALEAFLRTTFPRRASSGPGSGRCCSGREPTGSKIPDEAIQGEALRQRALLWLKHGREPGFWHQVPGYLDALGRILAQPDGLRAIEALL